MTSTISGSVASPVTLISGGAYTSPVTISGIVNAGSDVAVYVESPWTLSITSTGELESGGFDGIFAPARATIGNAGYIRGRAFDGIFLADGGLISNAAGGTIEGGLQGIYAYYKNAATIINAGTIFSGRQGVHSGPGYIENLRGGEIYGGAVGVTITQPMLLTNAGLIESGQGYAGTIGTGVAVVAGDVVFNSGTIIGYEGLVSKGGNVENLGLIEGETHDNGTGLIAPGSASTAVLFTAPGNFTEGADGIVLGSVTGDGGTLQIYGGTLTQISGFAVDRFSGAAELGGSLDGFGTISGFGLGDTLHIDGITADTGIFLNHTLMISEGDSLTGALTFAGYYGSGGFSVQADAAGSTDIFLLCFCAGTRIATPGGTMPVEALRIGDELQTLHAGVRRIKFLGTRSYDAQFAARNQDVWPVCIRRNALGEGLPARDLYVSPGHGLYIDGMLIPALLLINGVSITRTQPVTAVHYTHIEMESHEIVFAEACPTETFLDGSLRGQFQNSAEYARLHGNTPQATPCAERVEQGFLLHAIQQRIGRRAGIAETAEPDGPLQGYIDCAGPERLTGWARHPASGQPVCLDVCASRQRIGRVLANGYRRDLRDAGIGEGMHGFEFSLPAGQAGPFEIRGSRSGALLPLTDAARAAIRG